MNVSPVNTNTYGILVLTIAQEPPSESFTQAEMRKPMLGQLE